MGILDFFKKKNNKIKPQDSQEDRLEKYKIKEIEFIEQEGIDTFKTQFTHAVGNKLAEGNTVYSSVDLMGKEMSFFIENKFFEITSETNEYFQSFNRCHQYLSENLISIPDGEQLSENSKGLPFLIGLVLPAYDGSGNHAIYIAIYKDKMIISNRGYGAPFNSDQKQWQNGSFIYKGDFEKNIEQIIKEIKAIKEIKSTLNWNENINFQIEQIINPYRNSNNHPDFLPFKEQKYGTCSYANLKALMCTMLAVELGYDNNKKPSQKNEIFNKAKIFYKKFTNDVRKRQVELLLSFIEEGFKVEENINMLAHYIASHHDVNKPQEVELIKKIFTSLQKDPNNRNMLEKHLMELHQDLNKKCDMNVLNDMANILNLTDLNLSQGYIVLDYQISNTNERILKLVDAGYDHLAEMVLSNIYNCSLKNELKGEENQLKGETLVEVIKNFRSQSIESQNSMIIDLIKTKKYYLAEMLFSVSNNVDHLKEELKDEVNLSNYTDGMKTVQVIKEFTEMSTLMKKMKLSELIENSKIHLAEMLFNNFIDETERQSFNVQGMTNEKFLLLKAIASKDEEKVKSLVTQGIDLNFSFLGGGKNILSLLDKYGIDKKSQIYLCLNKQISSNTTNGSNYQSSRKVQSRNVR